MLNIQVARVLVICVCSLKETLQMLLKLKHTKFDTKSFKFTVSSNI